MTTGHGMGCLQQRLQNPVGLPHRSHSPTDMGLGMWQERGDVRTLGSLPGQPVAKAKKFQGNHHVQQHQGAGFVGSMTTSREVCYGARCPSNRKRCCTQPAGVPWQRPASPILLRVCNATFYCRRRFLQVEEKAVALVPTAAGQFARAWDLTMERKAAGLGNGCLSAPPVGRLSSGPASQ